MPAKEHISDDNMQAINHVMNMITLANNAYESDNSFGKLQVEIAYEKGVVRSVTVDPKTTKHFNR